MSRQARAGIGRLFLYPVAALALVLALRVLGPSDLGRHVDQSKTLAFTADIVLNRQFFLPRDATGAQTLKPPLVNWVGALLPALGFWDEWALKMPSILGAVATVLLCAWMTRRLMRALLEADAFEPRDAAPSAASRERWASAAGAAAGVVYLASVDTIKHAYFLRPDMLNTALLTVAWVLATIGLTEDQPRRQLIALGFWIAIGLAFLTKGPTALIAVLYAALAARLLHGRWAALDRLGWRWGLPLAVAMFGIWLVPAYLIDPYHVTHRLIGIETVDRLIGRANQGPWPLSALATSWDLPAWLVLRSIPWAILAVVALAMIGPRRWFRHPLSPAILWLFAVLLFFVPVARRGGSYVLPAYPAVATLAVYALIRGVGRVRLAPSRAPALGLLTVVALLVGHLVIPFETGAGDHQKAFTRKARQIVRDDPVVFMGLRDSSTITLFGRHQIEPLSPEAVRAAKWVVRPVDASPDPFDAAELELVETSEPVRSTRDNGSGVQLGLYRRLGNSARSTWSKAGRPN